MPNLIRRTTPARRSSAAARARPPAPAGGTRPSVRPRSRRCRECRPERRRSRGRRSRGVAPESSIAVESHLRYGRYSSIAGTGPEWRGRHTRPDSTVPSASGMATSSTFTSYSSLMRVPRPGPGRGQRTRRPADNTLSQRLRSAAIGASLWSIRRSTSANCWSPATRSAAERTGSARRRQPIRLRGRPPAARRDRRQARARTRGSSLCQPPWTPARSPPRCSRGRAPRQTAPRPARPRTRPCGRRGRSLRVAASRQTGSRPPGPRSCPRASTRRPAARGPEAPTADRCGAG